MRALSLGPYHLFDIVIDIEYIVTGEVLLVILLHPIFIDAILLITFARLSLEIVTISRSTSL